MPSRTVQYCVRVDKDVAAIIDRLSQKYNIDKADILRLAIYIVVPRFAAMLEKLEFDIDMLQVAIKEELEKRLLERIYQ